MTLAVAIITKLLSMLIYPVSSSLLIAALGLLIWRLGWIRIGFYVVVLAWGWLYLCAQAPFSYYLMGRLERDFPPLVMSEVEKADAIVLLGGAMRGDTQVGTLPDLNQYADRLVHAVALYKAGKADFILLSGGSAPGTRSEAHLMRDVLAVMGVPAQHLILEDQSKNTHDNAVNSALLLKSRDMNRILLVTSAFHMPRANALFQAQDLEVVPAPTDYQGVILKSRLPGGIPGVKNLYRTTEALHEIAGYWVYRWRGWL
jgi:uncharacterized SAM-binding protein YcdF (DUF218 family)